MEKNLASYRAVSLQVLEAWRVRADPVSAVKKVIAAVTSRATVRESL